MQSPTEQDMTGSLPPEVLVHIFGYLEVKDVCNLCTVCHRWRGIIHHADNMWKEQCYKLIESRNNVLLDRTIGFSWRTIFQRNYGNNAIKRQWKEGKFSNPRTYKDLPTKIMCTMDKKEWGELFQTELDRL